MVRLGIALVCLAALLSACGSGGGSSKAPKHQPLVRSVGRNGCKEVRAPHSRGNGHRTKPKGKLDTKRKWSLAVSTNCGSFTVALDVRAAPNTTASLVALAKAKFFDGTTFHRIVPGFVIQGGDPTGTGQGGPGYTTVDPPNAGARYTRGVVAMAKTPGEPPGTAGSQFFVVTGADTGLPPDYAVVGRVVKGLGVVERIGRLGNPATEQPTQAVVISRITVQRG